MNFQLKKLIFSEKTIDALIVWAVALMPMVVWFACDVIRTGRPPDFRFLLAPLFWASVSPLVCFYLVARYELPRRKERTLPYLLAYMAAAIFYSTFIMIGLPKWAESHQMPMRIVWYLVFTTAVLLVGILLHRRAIQHSGAGKRSIEQVVRK